MFFSSSVGTEKMGFFAWLFMPVWPRASCSACVSLKKASLKTAVSRLFMAPLRQLGKVDMRCTN